MQKLFRLPVERFNEIIPTYLIDHVFHISNVLLLRLLYPNLGTVAKGTGIDAAGNTMFNKVWLIIVASLSSYLFKLIIFVIYKWFLAMIAAGLVCAFASLGLYAFAAARAYRVKRIKKVEGAHPKF